VIICLFVIFMVFLVGAVAAWLYAGWQTGREFIKVKAANPSVPIQINWASVFYQGLAWIALFSSLISEIIARRNLGVDSNETPEPPQPAPPGAQTPDTAKPRRYA
jgi:hypothetical protein